MCQAATRPLHQQLDDRLGSLQLDDPSQFAVFLHAMTAGFTGWESWLEHHWHMAPQAAQPVWRMPGLLRDLTAVAIRYRTTRMPLEGEAGDSGLVAPPPCCDGCMLGVFYVLEGSRLGARFLVRRVPESFPREFLADGRTIIAWPRLCSMLDALGTEEIGCATRTACLVFQTFIDTAGGNQPVAAPSGSRED